MLVHTRVMMYYGPTLIILVKKYDISKRCFAYATSDEITIDPTEIEEARWFSLDEIDLICKNKHPDKITIPTERTIANQLINYWNSNKSKL